MKQSSIEFAVTSLEKLIPSGNDLVVGAILLQVKAMHEDEIMDAYDAGLFDGSMDDVDNRMYYNHKDYYKKTFNTKEK